jgi:thioredoxin-related protein
MKRLIFLALITLVTIQSKAQSTAETVKSPVKWYTIQEAEKLNQKDPRPIFVDTYTDWCGWCKKMDRETFTNPVIANILNTKFYPVKFNAESKESVTFMGHTFVNDGKAGNAHQLAVALLGGQLSYPTVVFIIPDKDKPKVQPVPGFREPKDMEVLLSFFGEKAYLTQSWDAFQSSFKGKIQ